MDVENIRNLEQSLDFDCLTNPYVSNPEEPNKTRLIIHTLELNGLAKNPGSSSGVEGIKNMAYLSSSIIGISAMANLSGLTDQLLREKSYFFWATLPNTPENDFELFDSIKTQQELRYFTCIIVIFQS